MTRLRAGHARPLRGGVNELRAKARPTECGKVGCRAACPQAAADVCVNEKPCGLCCRGRRPRRPAEGSRPLPTMQRIKGVVMARLRAGHARPLQTAVNGSRMRGAREGGSPAPFPLTGCRGRLRAAYMPLPTGRRIVISVFRTNIILYPKRCCLHLFLFLWCRVIIYYV